MFEPLAINVVHEHALLDAGHILSIQCFTNCIVNVFLSSNKCQFHAVEPERHAALLFSLLKIHRGFRLKNTVPQACY